MPHRIDIDGISQKLFVVKNLAFASKSFCEYFRVDRLDESDKPIGWHYYLGWLKSTVSESLIEIAVKSRVLQDFLKEEENPVDFNALERKALGGGIIARFLPSQEAIPMREVCNKIIHATDVALVWIDTDDSDGSYEFWNGEIILEGRKGQEYWRCEVYVIEFCVAMERFLGLLSAKVDWYHIYKHDE